MEKKNIQKAVAVTGVIGGMLLLKSAPVFADEYTENNLGDEQQLNVYARTTNKGQVVNTDGTYLRIRAQESTNSEILGTMTSGTTFDILSKNGQWYKIQYNGIVGYVYYEYVEEIVGDTSNVLYTGTVYNAEPNLRVRSGASLNSSVLGYVLNNSQVSIVAMEGQWYKIKYNGGYGYVHGDYVSINGSNDEAIEESIMNKIGYAYDLDGLSLRVRSGASAVADVIGYLYEGESVNVIGEVNGWYKISYNNSTAYVSKDYITFENVSGGNSSNSNETTYEKGYVIDVAGSNLRVRQAPSTDSLVLGYLYNNESVDIIGKEGNWYKISFRDSIGYVSADYIKLGEINNGGNGNVSVENSSDAYNIILEALKAQVGSPYVWGGSGEYLTTNSLNELKLRFPVEAAEGEYLHAEGYVNQGYRAFDCSGLMQWGFAQAGISISRTTYGQIYDGYEVSLNSLKEGDLLFSADLGHVGMYIGNDQWIEASFTGNFIRITNVPWHYVTRARRILK